MATNETVYVTDNGDDGIEIMEEGFITPQNISQMSFSFDAGKEITESLNKKNTKSRERVSVTKHGRTGYTPLTCTYPNKRDKSSKIMLTDCIIQYRLGIDREDSDYGRSYVCIGVPTIYINKIRSDARKNSGLEVGVKDTVKVQENCYWLNCTLDRLSEADTWIVYRNGDEEIGGHGTVYSILAGLKSSLVADIMMTCSGSMATQKTDDELDLINGKYTLTMKPTEVFIRDVSDKVGPTLDDTNRRRKEGATKVERFLASDKLAEFAMRNLSL